MLLLNSRVLKSFGDRQWDEAAIDARTLKTIEALLTIWPVPAGHKVSIAHTQSEGSAYVEVSDLLAASRLSAGQTLHSRPGKYGGHTATVLSDGRIEVADEAFESLSRAGIAVRKRHTNAWMFWCLLPNAQQPIADVRAAYLDASAQGTD